MNKYDFFAVINILAQIAIMFAYQLFGLIWPLYITMAALSLIVFMQTIAYGAFSVGLDNVKKDQKERHNGIALLVIITYMASCYQLYMLEFTVISLMGFTHILLAMSSIFFRSLNNK